MTETLENDSKKALNTFTDVVKSKLFVNNIEYNTLQKILEKLEAHGLGPLFATFLNNGNLPLLINNLATLLSFGQDSSVT